MIQAINELTPKQRQTFFTNPPKGHKRIAEETRVFHGYSQKLGIHCYFSITCADDDDVEEAKIFQIFFSRSYKRLPEQVLKYMCKCMSQSFIKGFVIDIYYEQGTRDYVKEFGLDLTLYMSILNYLTKKNHKKGANRQ